MNQMTARSADRSVPTADAVPAPAVRVAKKTRTMMSPTSAHTATATPTAAAASFMMTTMTMSDRRRPSPDRPSKHLRSPLEPSCALSQDGLFCGPIFATAPRTIHNSESATDRRAAAPLSGGLQRTFSDFSAPFYCQNYCRLPKLPARVVGSEMLTSQGNFPTIRSHAVRAPRRSNLSPAHPSPLSYPAQRRSLVQGFSLRTPCHIST